VRELVDAGIRAGVLMAPIVPGISSKPALIERTIKAVADHGARFVGSNVMHLDGGTRDHFMRWLARECPQLVDAYTQLYAGKYAPAAYRQEVAKVVGLFKEKHGMNSVTQNAKLKTQTEPGTRQRSGRRLALLPAAN